MARSLAHFGLFLAGNVRCAPLFISTALIFIGFMRGKKSAAPLIMRVFFGLFVNGCGNILFLSLSEDLALPYQFLEIRALLLLILGFVVIALTIKGGIVLVLVQKIRPGSARAPFVGVSAGLHRVVFRVLRTAKLETAVYYDRKADNSRGYDYHQEYNVPGQEGEEAIGALVIDTV
jgi:hypothetical protein